MPRGKRIPVVAAIDEVVCIVLNEAWIIVLICRQTIGQRNQLQRYATPECIIADFSYGGGIAMDCSLPQSEKAPLPMVFRPMGREMVFR